MYARLMVCLALLLLVLAPVGALSAAPPGASCSFDVSLAPNASATFTLPPIRAPGCLLAEVPSWSGATSLTLRIISSASTRPYTSASDLQGPLWVSYALDQADLKDTTWSVTVERGSGSATARGKLLVEYPPNQLPCEFAATSLSRGRVGLSWVYTGSTFKGQFLVERSNNLRTWQAVSACTQAPVRSTSYEYECSDSPSKAGTYWYRACAVTSGSSCGPAAVTPPLRVSVR